MNILDYADALNLELEIRYYPNQERRFCARFARAEIKKGGLLAGVHGSGSSPANAVEDYVTQLRGERLIIGAYSDSRREFDVPKNLMGLP